METVLIMYLKKSQRTEHGGVSQGRVGQSVSSQLQFQQQVFRLKSIESSRRELIDAVSVEIKFAKVAEARDSRLRDLTKVVVIEVKLDQRVKKRAIECLIVDRLEGVTVENETEYGEALEGVGRDARDGSVKNGQRVDLNRSKGWSCLVFGMTYGNVSGGLDGLDHIRQTARTMTDDGHWLVDGGSASARSRQSWTLTVYGDHEGGQYDGS